MARLSIEPQLDTESVSDCLDDLRRVLEWLHGFEDLGNLHLIRLKARADAFSHDATAGYWRDQPRTHDLGEGRFMVMAPAELTAILREARSWGMIADAGLKGLRK